MSTITHRGGRGGGGGKKQLPKGRGGKGGKGDTAPARHGGHGSSAVASSTTTAPDRVEPSTVKSSSSSAAAGRSRRSAGRMVVVAYALLVALRGWCAVWGTTAGYVHPDEFFQSPEVAAASLFATATPSSSSSSSSSGGGSSSLLPQEQQIRWWVPWEFDPAFACRSIVPLPLFVSGLPFLALKYLNQTLLMTGPGEGNWLSSSKALLLAPRVFVFLLSLFVDMSVYKVARMWGWSDDRVNSVMITLSSSWVMLLFHTRTFSNTFESILLSLSYFFVIRSMMPKQKAPSLIYDWTLGMLVAAGIFSRFTFTFFFFPMGIAYLLWHSTCGLWPLLLHNNSEKPRSSLVVSHTLMCLVGRLLIMLLGFLALSCVFAVCDSLYFGSLKLHFNDKTLSGSDIANLMFRPSTWHKLTWSGCLTLTPWNSLHYNMQVDNLKEHGIHPRYTHLLVNFPMLYGPLAVCTLGGLISYLSAQVQGHPPADNGDDDDDDDDKDTAKGAASLLFIWRSRLALGLCIVSGLSILSLAPHQEPRFLVPLIMPLALLCPIAQHTACSEAETTTDDVCIRKKRKATKDKGMKTAVAKSTTDTASHGGRFRRIPLLLLLLWIVFNACLLLFFGNLHQAGVVPSLLALSSSTVHPSSPLPALASSLLCPQHDNSTLLNSETTSDSLSAGVMHVVYFKTYMPPRFLLSYRHDIQVHDAHGDPDTLQQILRNIPSQQKVALLAPASVDLRPHLEAGDNFIRARGFWPHVSMEDPPHALNELYLSLYLRRRSC